MKSAYELAMERFKTTDDEPARTLTNEQKLALADIENRYKAKIAERELFLQKELNDAIQSGHREDAEQIQTQLRNERLRLEEEKEDAKEKIRKSCPD
jgi:hypothetical protein